MSGFVSRGFAGRRHTPAEIAARLPPGQYAESGFPVLTAGPTPVVPRESWRFEIDGMVGGRGGGAGRSSRRWRLRRSRATSTA